MNFKKNIFYIVIALIFVMIVKYSDFIFSKAGMIILIFKPIIIGCVIAYIINILTSMIENIGVFKSQSSPLYKYRRPISILLSFVIIFLVITLLVKIIIPQIVDAFSVVIAGVPPIIDKFSKWLVNTVSVPEVGNFVNSLDISWPSLIQKVTTYLTTGLSGVLSSTFVIVNGVTGVVMNFVIALIFAIYILGGKDKLAYQFNIVFKTYVNSKIYNKVMYFLNVANDTFKKFIIGQFTEAIIIGVLCTLGMMLLKFPYATMIGTLIGTTALLPVVGAYLGAFIGAFMIFTVNPIHSIGFLVFIVVLQQLEGNLIYPRVVGSSIGLPGIWVLGAVTVGGGIGGITGMLIAVPLTATFYKILKEDVKKKTEYITN